MNFKSSRGVTLLALTITIIVMLIISGTVIYNTNSHIRIDKVNKLYNDIEKINSKIDDYYLKYGEIPTIGGVYCDKNSLLSVLQDNSSNNNSSLMSDDNIYINPNDGNDYFIIDLEKLDLGTLNYGIEGYNSAKEGNTSVSDVYIINKFTHQVYYPSGIVVKEYMYYAYNLDNKKLPNKYNIKSSDGICKIDNYNDEVKINNLKLYGTTKEIEVEPVENLWPSTAEGYHNLTDASIDEEGWITINASFPNDSTITGDTLFINFWTKVNSKLEDNTEYTFVTEVEEWNCEKHLTLEQEMTGDVKGQFNQNLTIDANKLKSNKLIFMSVNSRNDTSQATYMSRTYTSIERGKTAKCKFRISLLKGRFHEGNFPGLDNLNKPRIENVGEYTENLWINDYHPISSAYVTIDSENYINVKCDYTAGTSRDWINFWPKINNKLKEQNYTFSIEVVNWDSNNELMLSEKRSTVGDLGQFDITRKVSANDLKSNRLLLISEKCNNVTNPSYMSRSYITINPGDMLDCKIRIGLFDGFVAADSFDLYENLGKYRIPIQINDGTNDRTFNIYIDEPLKENDYIDLLNKKLVKSTGTEEDINMPNISDYLTEGENTITVKTTTIPSKIELDYES